MMGRNRKAENQIQSSLRRKTKTFKGVLKNIKKQIWGVVAVAIIGDLLENIDLSEN